jgi:hypothetical protein
VKFLLDHDVPDDLSYLLEQLGHDVTLRDEATSGHRDYRPPSNPRRRTGCAVSVLDALG